MASAQPDTEVIFKVLVIGDSGTGKTSLMDRYIENVFNPEQIPTIGVDFRMKRLVIDETKIRLQLWDTAGQERFRALCASFYRGCHGVIIVYDVTKPASFANTKHWLEEIERNCTENVTETTILVGNKDDDTDGKAVSTEEAQAFANQANLLLFETSAATGKNVEELFDRVARLCVAAKIERTPTPPPPTAKIQLVSEPNRARNNKCC